MTRFDEAKELILEFTDEVQDYHAKLKYDEVSEIFDKAIDAVMASRTYVEVQSVLTGLRDTIEESGILKTFHPAMYSINIAIRKYGAMGTGQVSQDEKENIANEIREWKVRFLK